MGVNALEVRRRVMMAQPHEAVASGAVASFRTDVVSELPMEFDLLPIQNLNGQANPYPPGGGKNVLNLDTNVTVLTGTVPSAVSISSAEGTLTVTESYYNRNSNKFGWMFKVEENTDYSIGYTANSTATIVIKVYAEDGSEVYNTSGSATGEQTKQFNTGANTTLYFYVSITTWGQTITLTKVQIEKGSATPYAPYSNLCPITGHDGFTRTRTGINVWDEELEGGSIGTATGENTANVSTTRSKNYIRVIPNTSYYMLLPWAHIFWYDINKNYISYVRNNVTEDGAIHGKTITAPNNAYYMRFRCSGTYGTTYKNDISINYPATDTAYHPYTGVTKQTTFPTPPGTVYGGHIRDNGDGTGTLTVNYINYQLTTPFRVGENGKSAQYTLANTASGHTLATNPFLCNRYKPSNYSALYDNHVHFANASLLAVMSSDEIGTTQTAWRDYFAENPTYVCYKLATPQTYTLSLEAIQSLIGQNNVWVDNADSVSVEYWGH